MGLNKYEIFLKAAETGNITKTAELLHYTQAGVSHAVNAVEKEAGVALLVRSPSGVTLTANGLRLLEPIRALVNDSRRLSQVMEEMKGVVSGTLRLGTFTSVSSMWIPSIIRGFRAKYPEVEFELLAGDFDGMNEGILSGKMDCGFLTAPVIPRLRFVPLYRDPMVVLLPENHPLTAKKALCPADIENEPFILPVEGNDTEEQEIMKTFAHKPPVRYRLNDDLSVMAMVSGGFGLTLMPEMLLAHTRFSFAVRPMEPPAYRLIGIASLPEERISLLTIRFMEYLAELAADGMFGKSAGGQPDRAERESGTSKLIECVKNRLNMADNSDKIK